MDASIYRLIPRAVVRPKDVREVFLGADGAQVSTQDLDVTVTNYVIGAQFFFLRLFYARGGIGLATFLVAVCAIATCGGPAAGEPRAPGQELPEQLPAAVPRRLTRRSPP